MRNVKLLYSRDGLVHNSSKGELRDTYTLDSDWFSFGKSIEHDNLGRSPAIDYEDDGSFTGNGRGFGDGAGDMCLLGQEPFDGDPPFEDMGTGYGFNFERALAEIEYLDRQYHLDDFNIQEAEN